MENQHIEVVSKKTVNVFNRSKFFKNEIETLTLSQLNSTMDKLKILCLEFDPYFPEDRDQNIADLLQEFDLEKTLSNPFDFTNAVLQKMDLIETEIEKRKH